MIEVQYIDRVKHVFSHYRTNDDELSYAQTIDEEAETIEVSTTDGTTTVTVFTTQAVYHFGTFRADYIGHASRALVELLRHFRVNLPIEYVTAHQTFTVYLNGQKVVAGEREYPIAARSGVFELVEPVEWQISSAVLDTILRLAEEYNVTPVEIVESAVGAFYSLLTLADEYQVEPDEVISLLTTTVAQHHSESDSSDSTAEPSSIGVYGSLA
ncbi:hypothetical protein [Alicyclobacillus macrosporangiidus]|uniref:hypothetical protein n=1 Tax=Alicyclobacillus macrosporangiidus TaxID=392015 RepID=UPI000690E363|nr:hypothetical protein [Alicyclobacillus macrosporangiidus]